jgi:hypothetical protein
MRRPSPAIPWMQVPNESWMLPSPAADGRCHVNRRTALDPRIVLFLIAALTICSAVATGVASANPMPESAVLIHVQPWDPAFCQNNPIHACAQVVQYSEIEGDVEFDVFLANPFGFLSPFSSASMIVNWPETWQFTSFQDCLGGDVTTSIGDHTVSLQINYGSPISPGSFLLVGRFRMQVSGFGALDFDSVVFGAQHAGIISLAQAGVECTYSYLSCSNFMEPCGAHIQPDLLELHVPQGGMVTGTMSAWASFMCAPGQVQFLEAADWMELDVAWDESYSHAALTVNVNAAGLAPGVYPAVIRAVTQVVYCASVLVYVEPVSSVPDPGPVTRSRSWGGVKALYRNQ